MQTFFMRTAKTLIGLRDAQVALNVRWVYIKEGIVFDVTATMSSHYINYSTICVCKG